MDMVLTDPTTMDLSAVAKGDLFLFSWGTFNFKIVLEALVDSPTGRPTPDNMIADETNELPWEEWWPARIDYTLIEETDDRVETDYYTWAEGTKYLPGDVVAHEMQLYECSAPS